MAEITTAPLPGDLDRPANDIVLNHKTQQHHSGLIDSGSSFSSSGPSLVLSNNQSKSSLSSTLSEQLFDQSHLKPGKRASLLSYSQTLNMYRENLKKTNNPEVQCNFALFLIEAGNQLGQQDKHDYYSEAEKLLKQLAFKGHPHAQYQLAKLYASGVFSKKNGKPEYQKAFSLYVQASKRDHMDATFEAAECYEKGLGCHTNSNKAITFYKKAASLGHPGAMYRIGLANMNGELGQSVNTKEAVKWFARSVEAATPEYPEAVYKLANLYITGVHNIIFVDYDYSVSLLNQAAEMGYAPAALKLGECYEYGKLNCQPDPALSIHYYTLAAERGDRDACFALTAWYLVGSPNILPQSDEKAYIWAMRAAELGLAKAEYAIGYFSERGIGCEKNTAIAIDWYQKATKHGDIRARDRLQVISGCLSADTTTIEPNYKPKKKSSQDDCTIM